MIEARKCRMCGCTDLAACLHADGRPCCWVEDDFCSACDEKLTNFTFAIDDLARFTGEAGIKALCDCIAERQRQVEKEGFTAEHDRQWSQGEIAMAAAAYALNTVDDTDGPHPRALSDDAWPWADQWWKPDNPRRDLVKAVALLLAEIERRDRAQQGRR